MPPAERRAAPRRAARTRGIPSRPPRDRFFILTNADGAEDFKIVTAPIDARAAALARPRPACARPADPQLHVYKDYLVRLEREDGLPRIVIRHLAAGEEHAIAFDEEAYSLGILDGFEFDTTTLRFTYSSMTTPTRVYDYDMATRDPRAAQGSRDPVRPRPGRLRHAARLRAGAGRRDGAGVAALSQGHQARRQRAPACSTATAPTASRFRPPSASAGCRWSIAASSMPSPMSAAARTRAIAGTRTDAARRRSTPSGTSSRRLII